MKHSNEKNSCQCNDPALLIIDRNSASRIVAGLLLCAFFIFTAGYFLGKRTSAEETIVQTERTAFADQLSYAINSTYNHAAHNDINNEQEKAEKNIPESSDVLSQEEPSEITVVQPMLPVDAAPLHNYQAYLFGGTKKAVQQFAERLQKGIKIQVVQRTSRTAQGKMIHWYQAVTPLYPDKNELMALIDAITRIEKIKDVQVVSMRSSVNAEKKGIS